MSNHKDFILSPITDILKEIVSANAGIGDGIETYPLGEYIMQSVFLKMTGFQEQKLKCICWELATNDYEYRYKRFTLKPLGECSSYEEKKTIYKDLLELIKKHRPNFNTNEIDTNFIRSATISEIQSIFSSSNLSTWTLYSFLELMNDHSIISQNQFATPNNLFENILQEKYSLLYNHRNRCAHNTQSYQDNLPTLKALLSQNYKYDNYFIRFTLLILLDKIFIDLYMKYLATLEES